MNLDTMLLSLIGIFTISMIVIFAMIIHNEKRNNQINLNITKSIHEIQNSLNKDFISFNSNVNEEIQNLSERLNSNIIQSHKITSDIYQNIQERIIKIDETQKSLNHLSDEVISLQNLFHDKKNRGSFGEVELYSILEASYGIGSKFFAKQYKLSNGFICDAVIFGGENIGVLCIDSKFPLENYRRIYDEHLDSSTKEYAKRQFKEDIKKHIKDIADKYIIEAETADLAYMFIPSEAVFSEIIGNYSEIIDYSYACKVYMVSPTTLMAYITAIKSIYLGQQKDQKAKEIESLLAELSIEFNHFNKRIDLLYKDYEKLIEDFENINITSKKIIKKFTKIKQGETLDEGKQD